MIWEASRTAQGSEVIRQVRSERGSRIRDSFMIWSAWNFTLRPHSCLQSVALTSLQVTFSTMKFCSFISWWTLNFLHQRLISYISQNAVLSPQGAESEGVIIQRVWHGGKGRGDGIPLNADFSSYCSHRNPDLRLSKESVTVKMCLLLLRRLKLPLLLVRAASSVIYRKKKTTLSVFYLGFFQKKKQTVAPSTSCDHNCPLRGRTDLFTGGCLQFLQQKLQILLSRCDGPTDLKQQTQASHRRSTLCSCERCTWTQLRQHSWLPAEEITGKRVCLHVAFESLKSEMWVIVMRSGAGWTNIKSGVCFCPLKSKWQPLHPPDCRQF